MIVVKMWCQWLGDDEAMVIVQWQFVSGWVGGGVVQVQVQVQV
jgi:hypothetical protein